MKRILIVFLTVMSLLALPAFTLATPMDISGGVSDEYTYSEMVFVSGKPIKFNGTFKVSQKETDKIKTLSYKFSLTPEDKTLKGKLERKVNYQIDYTKYSDQGQTVGQGAVKSYSEDITINKDRYSLKDYQYSQSDVIDNCPASNYYSGTVKARKSYSLNKNEGQVIVDISGGDVGYNNFWGNTETQILEYTLDGYRDVTAKNATTRSSWQGTVKAVVSDSTTKTLNYDINEASLSSFAGGYMRVTNSEMVSNYEYDLPLMKAETTTTGTTTTTTGPELPDSVERNSDTVSISLSRSPRVERLIIPKFRDTGGHWAEEDINQLYSLDIFDGKNQFFLPDVAMTRVDFVKAVVKATNMRPDQTNTKKTATKKATAEVSPFTDINTADPNYVYIKEALDKGVISLSPQKTFSPDSPLTRAQAITILVRALGFQGKAPTPGYSTAFADDDSIPAWSKDCIYAAQQIGIIQGDSNNRVNANRVMTRAEASAMLNKCLGFLQKDLMKDYRDNIVLYS